MHTHTSHPEHALAGVQGTVMLSAEANMVEEGVELYVPSSLPTLLLQGELQPDVSTCPTSTVHQSLFAYHSPIRPSLCYLCVGVVQPRLTLQRAVSRGAWHRVPIHAHVRSAYAVIRVLERGAK